MYMIVKEEGLHCNVYLRNTDTHAELNLGRVSLVLVSILKEEGYNFDDTGLTFTEQWKLKINNDEVKNKLKRLAMPMNKPMKKIKANEQVKTKKEPVDILNIIYGIE